MQAEVMDGDIKAFSFNLIIWADSANGIRSRPLVSKYLEHTQKQNDRVESSGATILIMEMCHYGALCEYHQEA